MAFNLSETKIRQRLVEWRNLKALHAAQKKRNQQLEQRLKKLEQENQQLRAAVAERDRLIESLMLRLADLEQKVFGGKKKNNNSSGHQSSPSNSGSKQTGKKPRDKKSYQRPTPSDDEVTDTEYHTITACKHCGGQLSRFKEVIRYVEDIILPQLIKQATKTVTKHIIEQGYCVSCGNWSAAIPLRGSIVKLGKNVKLLVAYLVTILDCSYEQVKTLTRDLYRLEMSDGEIVHILKETAQTWQPEYHRLLKLIRAGPGAHFDETTWPIQIFAKHCYAWVMSAIGSPIRIYKLATSRGKDHAVELLGSASETFVRITDCYAAYKYLPGLQQICWVHLYRKIRDLLNNDNLPEKKKPHIQAWHDQFQALFADLRAALDEPFNKQQRARQEQDFRQRIELLRKSNVADPKPLADLKNLLVEYDQALFACLRFPDIPCHNNRAEQDIRPLVLKRKKSFGSRTEAGAHALEILLSVAWSTWHTNRHNFLPALAAIGEKRFDKLSVNQEKA